MRTLPCGLCLALAIVGAGCISRTDIPAEQMDRYWSLTPDPTATASPYRPALGERELPARWIVRQDRSLVRSTISLVRAADQLKQGAAEVQFSISPDHARTVADILAQAQRALQDLAQLTEHTNRFSRKRWAEILAKVLADVEAITRRASLDETQPEGEAPAEPLGLAAEPLLRMAAGYFDVRTGGRLLGDLGPAEIHRLRSVLAQLVLRLGFAMVGREMPADLRGAATTVMRQNEKIDAVRAALTELLTAGMAKAPRAAGGGEIRRKIQSILSASDKVLRIVLGFVAQWDRMKSVELELYHKGGEMLAAITVAVLPGKEVRLASVQAFQPIVAFRGTCRIVIEPADPLTGETVVTFQPVGEGGVDLRFEGIVYGLARLLVLPIDSGRVREVRVFSKSRDEGTQLLHLAVLMEASGGAKDSRRAIVFQDVRHRELLREPFSVRKVDRKTEQVFDYLTPTSRYTFRRVAGPPNE